MRTRSTLDWSQSKIFLVLYGLEAVTISNANRQTLYVTWKTALYKIFKLNDEVNLLYVQYVLLFCLYPMYLIYDYVFCLNKVLILFLFTVFFTMCLVFFEFNKLCSVFL